MTRSALDAERLGELCVGHDGLGTVEIDHESHPYFRLPHGHIVLSTRLAAKGYNFPVTAPPLRGRTSAAHPPRA